MRSQIREKLKRIEELYPPERLAASRERVRRLWRGEPPLDRLPFVLIPDGFSYYDDVFSPEEGLNAYLDAFIARGFVQDDTIPAFFTGCRMGAMPSLFGAPEVVAGKDYTCARILQSCEDVYALPEPEIRPGSAADQWLRAQRYYLEETEGALPVHANDMQGPLDVGGQIWGYDNLLVAPYEDEKAYACLMDKLTRGFLLLWDAQAKLLGENFLPTHLYAWDSVPPDNGGTLSCDALVMLSPAFFDAYVKPYLEAISDALGGLTVHSCGDFSQVAANLSAVRGLKGINASQMSARELLDAGASSDLVYIFLCPFEAARSLATEMHATGLRCAPTITGAWPRDWQTTGSGLLKRRVADLATWFTPSA